MSDDAQEQLQLSTEITALRQRISELEALVGKYERVDERLRVSEARLAGVLDMANEAIISVDELQQVVIFNQGAEHVFGYSATEVLGQPLDVLIPSRFVAPHRVHISEFEAEETSARLMGDRQEITARRKNGREFPAEASISKIQVEGRWILTVVLRDVTQRKQVEKEREDHIRQLRALNQAAQAITADLTIEHVLQTVATSARSLLDVKYAALGVHDGQGFISRFATAGIDPELKAQIGPPPIGRGLLGYLLHRGEPLIVDDIAGHQDSVGFPDHHPPMLQLLGVPIFSKDRLLGALYLADKQDGSNFAESDQQLVEMLALHAAIALENARLYEQTQRLAILEERERFAQDLHDGIIQSIYGVGLSLDQVRSDLVALEKSVDQQLDFSLQSLSKVINDIRNYIFDLRPQALAHEGLTARLDGLLLEMRANNQVQIEADLSPGLEVCLSEWQQRHLFHLSHEALSNAIRHAKANRVLLSLTSQADEVWLRIEDDGVGFEPPASVAPGHRGLTNMQARAAQLGATLEIDSAPQQGTRLSLRVKCRGKTG
jgi:PAS domain S-box-containing protein